MTTAEGKAYAEEHKFSFLETSAKSAENVVLAFETLVSGKETSFENFRSRLLLTLAEIYYVKSNAAELEEDDSKKDEKKVDSGSSQAVQLEATDNKSETKGRRGCC